MWNRVLGLAYWGEVFFSRMQGIAFDNPRRNGEYLLVRKLADVVRVAVDAGANRGDWTARVLDDTKARARVLCVEPDRRNADFIRRRFASRPGVSVHEVGLSDDASPRFFVAGPDDGSGNGYFVDGATDSAVQIPMSTLDRLSEEYGNIGFDLVKCDVEGEEISVLRGAEGLFRSELIGSMQIEYNSTWLRTGRLLKHVFEFAGDYKYSVLAATPFGFTIYPRYGEGLEDFRMRNLVLARPDHLGLLKPLGPSGRARVEAARLS